MSDREMEAMAREFLINKHGQPDCGEANGWINEVAVECAAFAASVAAEAWVPVSERLPEQDGGYLITDSEGFMLVSYFQVKQHRFVVVQDELATSPVAWQPLPQPYQQEEK